MAYPSTDGRPAWTSRKKCYDVRVLILGLDTSSLRASVALLRDGALLSHLKHEELNRHSERLKGMLETLLDDTGVKLEELSAIAVGVGPGSFTGLRVGLAFAEGLALGLGIPLLGVDSMRAMAAMAEATSVKRVWCAIDARRNEVFLACYGHDGRTFVKPCAVASEVANTWIATEDRVLGPEGERVVVGQVAETLALSPAHWAEPSALPDARGIVRLAWAGHTREAKPVYVREPDAIVPNLAPSPFDSPPGAGGSEASAADSSLSHLGSG